MAILSQPEFSSAELATLHVRGNHLIERHSEICDLVLDIDLTAGLLCSERSHRCRDWTIQRIHR